MEEKTWISNLYFIAVVTVTTHCRGGLNPPDDVLKGVFVDAFGRIQCAPTVGGKAICYRIKDSAPTGKSSFAAEYKFLFMAFLFSPFNTV